ncbi:hypothetical protein ACH4OV_25370 [Streptomyces diastaticus]|uniref:hypothetical protein n=1 Tax=Streptomyces diastaticus TaxID=1956 RepID=UPI0037AE854B
MTAKYHRIAAHYNRFEAWEMAKRLVDAEDEAARLRNQLSEARADSGYFEGWAVSNGHRLNAALRERDRYRLAWKSARTRAKWARWSACSELRFMRNMWADTSRDSHRYRLAWLSARRRAAEEAALGAQAVDELWDTKQARTAP